MTGPGDVTRYGPWALVTGASSGIGRAIAAQLCAAGFSIVLIARREHALRELAAQWESEHGVSTRVVATDLARPTAITEIASATADLDVGLVVLAAGYGSIGDFCAADPAVDADMIAVNIGAVTALAHLFGPRLAKRDRGALVLFSSILGWQGCPLQATYAATKAYNQSLAEALRLEWQAAGVEVLAVAPGPVHTGFADRAAMNMTSATNPDVVARATLSALGRRGTVIPGAQGKLLTYSLRTAPRTLRSRVMRRIGNSLQHRPAPDAGQSLRRRRVSGSPGVGGTPDD